MMDTYKVEDGKLVKETICTLPGGRMVPGVLHVVRIRKMPL